MFEQHIRGVKPKARLVLGLALEKSAESPLFPSESAA
jgi:hypothetical protein